MAHFLACYKKQLACELHTSDKNEAKYFRANTWNQKSNLHILLVAALFYFCPNTLGFILYSVAATTKKLRILGATTMYKYRRGTDV